jgi:hypothetical protein
MTVGHRAAILINADLDQSAAIWRAWADQLFGNLPMIDDFNHALKCADRLETQLRKAPIAK